MAKSSSGGGGGGAKVMSFEDFAAQRGAQLWSVDPGMTRYPRGRSNAQERQNRKKIQRETVQNIIDREAARAEYDGLVRSGQVRPPNYTETLIRSARGHPDNESTQAARRLLTRRGIRW